MVMATAWKKPFFSRLVEGFFEFWDSICDAIANEPMMGLGIFVVLLVLWWVTKPEF